MWRLSVSGVLDGIEQRRLQRRRQQSLMFRLSGERVLVWPGGQPAALAREQQLNLELAISSVSLGLALVGSLGYPWLALFSMPWFLYACVPMVQDAYRAARRRVVTVDTLSSIVVVGCLFGQYYVPANLATTIYYLSRKLLQKVKKESRKQVVDVFRQLPQNAWLVLDAVEVEVPLDQLQVGDRVVVGAGGVIPADGIVIQGAAAVDQHILTGEAQPAEKGVGASVFASTVVISGRILVQVEQAGQATVVAQIGQILNQTAEYKSSLQLRSEELTNQTVLPTLILGAMVLPFVGPYAAVAVLNSHYKYKMNIVAPIGILTFLNLMSRHQILIKDGRTLDLLNQVDTLVFDKTGTLTEEQPTVEKIHVYAAYDEVQVLALAAAAEHRQSHPIARAILQEAVRRQLSLPDIDEASYRAGYGVSVRLDGQPVRVGSRRFFEMEGISISESMEALWVQCSTTGHSLVLVACGEQLIGAVELRATVRAEARQVLGELRRHGRIRTFYLISGDHELPTRKLAQELGIDHYFAETLPEAKAALIAQLQAEGRFVCFVGDGNNDSIALKKSQVSVSLRGASAVATDTAQIILMDGTLKHLNQLFVLAQQYDTNAKIGFATQLIPMGVGMGGALFAHVGLSTTILLGYGGLLVGVLNSLLPLLLHRWQQGAADGRFMAGQPLLPTMEPQQQQRRRGRLWRSVQRAVGGAHRVLRSPGLHS
jgi:Cu2+-exporting ATPase